MFIDGQRDRGVSNRKENFPDNVPFQTRIRARKNMESNSFYTLKLDRRSRDDIDFIKY